MFIIPIKVRGGAEFMCQPQILDYIRVENVGRVKNVGRCQKMSEGCLGQIKGVKTSETSEECLEQIQRVKTSEDIGRHWKTLENIGRMSAEVGSEVWSKYGT